MEVSGAMAPAIHLPKVRLLNNSFLRRTQVIIHGQQIFGLEDKLAHKAYLHLFSRLAILFALWLLQLYVFIKALSDFRNLLKQSCEGPVLVLHKGSRDYVKLV